MQRNGLPLYGVLVDRLEINGAKCYMLGCSDEMKMEVALCDMQEAYESRLAEVRRWSLDQRLACDEGDGSPSGGR